MTDQPENPAAEMLSQMPEEAREFLRTGAMPYDPERPIMTPQSMSSFTADMLAADPILKFFEYLHLPEHLQVTSRMFCDLAFYTVAVLPWNAERTVALRKLLEAKDAAVRACLP